MNATIRILVYGAIYALMNLSIADADITLREVPGGNTEVYENGIYRGNVGSPYDADSINNQFGKYGSQFSEHSINNPFRERYPTQYQYMPYGR